MRNNWCCYRISKGIKIQRTWYSSGLLFGFKCTTYPSNIGQRTGMAIGASLGEVLKVDVADTGV